MSRPFLVTFRCLTSTIFLVVCILQNQSFSQVAGEGETNGGGDWAKSDCDGYWSGFCSDGNKSYDGCNT